MKTNHLTIKQEAFCQAYIRTGDKSAAYREAYSYEKMKAETINRKAFDLFNNGNVRARISDLQDKVAVIAEEKFQITAEEMLRHLNILRNARIDEFVDFIYEKVLILEEGEDGNPVFGEKPRMIFKPFHELTKEQLMCIESVKQNRYGEIELKLHGKEWSIEKINKHIGFYEKDNTQKANLLVPEERSSRLQQLLEKANRMKI